MTRAGRASSNHDKRAAAWNNASSAVPTPGAIAPPRYSPAPEIALKVVAVPRSTTRAGVPYLRIAAIASTSRSAPTSEGGSYRTRSRGCKLSPTTHGSWPKVRRENSASVGARRGTTLATATASMASNGRLLAVISVRSSVPYSSAVRPSVVWSRQWARSVIPS